MSASVTGATSVNVSRGGEVIATMSGDEPGYSASVGVTGEVGSVVALRVTATSGAQRVAESSTMSVTVTACPVTS